MVPCLDMLSPRCHCARHSIVVLPLQVGDGTTSVVLLAGEFLKAAKPFVEEGVHPQVGCTVRRHLARCAGAPKCI